MTYSIRTLSGRGLPVGTDPDGYHTRLAAEEMAEAFHDGDYEIVETPGRKAKGARMRPKWMVQMVPAREEGGWFHYGLAVVTVPHLSIVSAYLTDAETIGADCGAPRFVATKRRR